MITITSKNLIQIIRNTLNHMDPRLIDHGARVAYMIWKTLSYENKTEKLVLRDITMLSLLHDIGAYKTEEIDRMLQFEISNIFEHSAYGYLFLKHLSPLSDYVDIILCHHIPYQELKNLHIPHFKLTQLLTLCDRIDVLMEDNTSVDEALKKLEETRNILASADIMDMLLQANQDLHFLTDIYEHEKDIHLDILLDILYETDFSREDVFSYLQMIAFSIDFRSEFMVSHTLTTSSISVKLGQLLEFNEEEIEKIHIGSLLHDLGKIAIPINILDYPGKLTDEDMKIMQSHVAYSADILNGFIDQDICDIAIHHHEKLNGLGYPYALHANDLSTSERITAVGDVFSALLSRRSYKKSFDKADILSIFRSNVEDGSLDPVIVQLVIDHYDEIVDCANKQCDPLIQIYDNIASEYHYIMNHFFMYVASLNTL